MIRNILLLYSLSNVVVVSYERKPCTRSVRPQFQFPDCYLPPMDTSIPLSSASFLMSHDSATGYIKKGSLASKGQVISLYSKNQVGTAYDQLNDGARALDLRPKLLSNGTVIFHHGDIDIPVAFEQLVSDAVRWCSENDDELVLLFHSNLYYEGGFNTYADDFDEYAGTSAMASVYESLGVPYYDCGSVYGLTVAETMEMAALPSGGYLLALDGQDYYGSFCGKMNWVYDQLVTCYPNSTDSSVKCTSKNSKQMAALKEYILASANNDPTDSSQSLGPPEDLYTYPFNEIQAFWQVDMLSASIGITHFSSLLDDNRKSKVNEEMVQMIHNGEFDAISLFAVDNVALNGNALLSVMRNTCGQSTADVCGPGISKPKMSYVHFSKIGYLLMVGLYLAAVVVVGYMIWTKHPLCLSSMSHRKRKKVYHENRDNTKTIELKEVLLV